MPKTKIRWNSERVVSLSAIGISFITLIIFIYQTNLMSRQNYLSIMPYLALSTTRNASEYIFELNVKNHGVGPAILESVTLVYQEKRYDLPDYNDDFFQFLTAIAPDLDRVKNVSSSTLNKGMAIPANYDYNVFRVNGSPEDYQLMTGILDTLLQNGLDYEIIYKSIQDERWRLHLNSEGPEKLK